MGAESKIEWTDHTWNPFYGCPDDGRRTPACDHCYARSWAKRSGIVDFDHEVKRASEKTLRAPLNRKVYKPGDRVFVCSLSDVCHCDVNDWWIMEMWEIVRKRSDLFWSFLTKRPQNLDATLRLSRGSSAYDRRPLEPSDLPPNWWLGVTVENQDQADARLPDLVNIPAEVRFVSVEPMLGFVDLGPWMDRIDWVICGGESGPGARPMHPEWARSLLDQCVTAGVPFFFKQWGEWGRYTGEDVPGAMVSWVRKDGRYSRNDEEFGADEFWDDPGSTVMDRLGKKKAGNILDGEQWKQMPATKALAGGEEE